MTKNDAIRVLAPLMSRITVAVVGPWHEVDDFLRQIANDFRDATYERSRRIVKAPGVWLVGVDESFHERARGLSLDLVICLRQPPAPMMDQLRFYVRGGGEIQVLTSEGGDPVEELRRAAFG